MITAETAIGTTPTLIDTDPTPMPVDSGAAARLQTVNQMVNCEARLDRVFSALSDPTRRAIVARLAMGESSVTGLAEPFDMSLPAVSKHLRVLESAGLLTRDIEGRVHRCRLVAKPLSEAVVWLETYRRFWEQQFDALANFLETTDPAPKRRSRRQRRH